MNDNHQVCERKQMEQIIILISNNVLAVTSISESEIFFISGFHLDVEAINIEITHSNIKWSVHGVFKKQTMWFIPSVSVLQIHICILATSHNFSPASHIQINSSNCASKLPPSWISWHSGLKITAQQLPQFHCIEREAVLLLTQVYVPKSADEVQPQAAEKEALAYIYIIDISLLPLVFLMQKQKCPQRLHSLLRTLSS